MVNKSQQSSILLPKPPETLLNDIRQLIENTRSAVSVTVNTALTILYWRIGKRVNKEILEEDRATYGEHIVVTLSRHLVEGYDQGFTEKNLRRMVQFAMVFPEEIARGDSSSAHTN